MKTFFKMLGFLTWAAGLVAGLIMDAILPVWCAAIISGSVLFAIGKLLENQEAMLANQKQILAELKNHRSGGKVAPRPKSNSERTNVFFSPDTMEKLRTIAAEKGTSVSGLIRMIVLEYLAKK